MTGLIVRLLAGWRLIRIRGRFSERLISQVALTGYRLWRIERHGDEFFGLITEDGYEFLSQLADTMGVTALTERRGGLPFRWRQIRRRPFLVVGLISAWLMVGYMTSHVWAITVVAPNLQPGAEATLIRAAEQSGLTIGASRQALDINRIRRIMLARLPQYSFIGIHLQGMVAVVSGMRFVGPPPKQLPQRLVSDARGRVTSVFIYMGLAKVAVGDYVNQGQTLIEGAVTDVPFARQSGSKTPTAQSVITPAKGKIMADVDYHVRVFQPYFSRRTMDTGRRFVQRFIQWNHQTVVSVPSLRSVPFLHYHTQRVEKPVSFGGVPLPVRMIELVYNEWTIRSIRLSRRRATQAARCRARWKMEQIAPKHDKPVSTRMRVRASKTGITVNLVWVVNRNIAAERVE